MSSAECENAIHTTCDTSASLPNRQAQWRDNCGIANSIQFRASDSLWSPERARRFAKRQLSPANIKHNSQFPVSFTIQKAKPTTNVRHSVVCIFNFAKIYLKKKKIIIELNYIEIMPKRLTTIINWSFIMFLSSIHQTKQNKTKQNTATREIIFLSKKPKEKKRKTIFLFFEWNMRKENNNNNKNKTKKP